MTPEIERLRELAEQLPTLEAIVASRHGERIDYDTLTGLSVGFCLDSCPDAALQKNYLSAGTQFPEHMHRERECLFVVKGDGYYTLDGQQVAYKKGSWINFPCGKAHDFYATTATVIYGITQPPCEGYPGVR